MAGNNLTVPEEASASLPLSGHELIRAVQNNGDVKITAGQLASLGAVSLRGVYLATNYGVLANGQQDDTAAIQAALTAAGVTGGVVILPAGICVITSTITIPSGVVLQGAGGICQTTFGIIPIYPTTLLWTGASLSGIIVDTASFTQGSGIRNLTIDGQANTHQGDIASNFLKAIRLRSGYQHVLNNVGLQNVGVGVSMEPDYTLGSTGGGLIENIWCNNVSMHFVNIGFDIGPNAPFVDCNATNSFAQNATAIPISTTTGYTTQMSLFDLTKIGALGAQGAGIPITGITPGVGVTLASGATLASNGSTDHLVAIQNSGGVTNNFYFGVWISNVITSAVRIGPLCDDNHFTGLYANCETNGSSIINIGWLYPTINNGAAACSFINAELVDTSGTGCTGITYGQSIGHPNRFSGYNATTTQRVDASGGLGGINYDDDWNKVSDFLNNIIFRGSTTFDSYVVATGNLAVHGGGVLLWGTDFFGTITPAALGPDVWALGRSPDGSTFIDTLQWTEKGSVILGDGAPANNATDGFVYIPTCSGTPIGTPTSYPGWVPMVFKSATNQLYIYNGGWKSVTVS